MRVLLRYGRPMRRYVYSTLFLHATKLTVTPRKTKAAIHSAIRVGSGGQKSNLSCPLLHVEPTFSALHKHPKFSKMNTVRSRTKMDHRQA
jgi:hypothetical protein